MARIPARVRPAGSHQEWSSLISSEIRLRLENLRFQGCGPIDLDIEGGQCVTLTGRSGSGKTLLLRAIADLDPHNGRVYLDGVECASLQAPEWRRRVGLLPAESQWWRESVGEHIGEHEPRWLQRLGFAEEALGWQIARLSTGERQRLALLRFLSNRPRILLIDEPTANLDPESTEQVEQLLLDYRTETNAAVLWVTHDAAQAQRVGSRRFVLEDGLLAPERQP